jgi:uncharacterized membrane protein YidH (DUF202 family)
MDSGDQLERTVHPPPIAEESAPQADVSNREATELERYHTNVTDASASTKGPCEGHFVSIRKFWRRQVSLAVPHVKCRDHLGIMPASHITFVSSLGEPNNTIANERTFLAWIRTSIALSMLGTIIAQLFRLQNAPSPTGVVSLYILAIPLACICQGAALLTALTGSHRYWRMQNAMARGQALAAGWEYWLMIGILGSVSRPHLISTRSMTGFTDDGEDASNTLCCYTRGCLNVVVSMTKAALLYPATQEGPNHWTPRSAVNARDIKHDLPTLNAAPNSLCE